MIKEGKPQPPVLRNKQWEYRKPIVNVLGNLGFIATGFRIVHVPADFFGRDKVNTEQRFKGRYGKLESNKRLETNNNEQEKLI